MRRIICLCAFLMAAAVCLIAGAQTGQLANLPDENLNYKVLYKWGLINKQAGRATLSLRSDPATNTYRAVLYARSEPWADKFYALRDTLTTVMDRTSLIPVRYTRAAHENGRYECDLIEFSHSDNHFRAECTHRRRGRKDTTVTERLTTLEAEGMTVDFVSAFFYLRALDFNSMLLGHSVTINIFSGKRKEYLRFKFCGIEEIKIDDKRRNAFKVEFAFTSDGRKHTSDPITAWVSTTADRTPLLIEGKLPIGKIRVMLSTE